MKKRLEIRSRSELHLRVGNRALVIGGEALLSGHDGPDFVVFSRDRIRWIDGGRFDESERDQVFRAVLAEAADAGLEIEISGPWGDAE